MIRRNGRGRSSRCVSESWVLGDILRPSARQMMIRQQDQTIDSIAGTLSTLAEQAGLMGREIVEHNEYVSTFRRLEDVDLDFRRMLDDIDRNVDKTDSKLNDAMRRMKKFIRQTEGTSLRNPSPSLL